MKSMSKCIEEGINAKAIGKVVTSCPYSLKSLKSRDRRMWWHKGFAMRVEPIPSNFNKRKMSCSLNLLFMGGKQ